MANSPIHDPKIIVALDMEGEDTLNNMIKSLSPQSCRLKIGKTLFTQYGPQFIQKCHNAGFEIFLDLKFHDIPQQVAGACKAAAQWGVWMVNVHASGGKAMLEAAKAAVETIPGKRPLLIGVTILTSLDTPDLTQLGITGSMHEAVMRLARLCYEAGLDGVVCSAQEAPFIKKAFGEQFLCVTPGIRLPEDDKQDQQRVMTPEAAFAAGSDYLVMGRSITHATSPLAVLENIHQRCGSVA